MFSRRFGITVFFLCSLLLLSACRSTGTETSAQMTQDAQYTAAAATIGAQFDRATATANATLILPTATQAPSNTPVPTATTSPSATPPPVVPQTGATATNSPQSTPGAPLIGASVSTNCRAGPGDAYAVVGSLPVGQQAAVLGRDASGQWWYIENPGRPGESCWVWGRFAEVTGDTAALPVVTPPPMPTFTATPPPSFSAAFSSVRNCGGVDTAIFTIGNVGGPEYESMNLTILDVNSGNRIFGPAASDAPFMLTSDECPPGGDSLSGDVVGYVGGSIESASSGRAARATIELCTEDGLEGACTQRTVDFTIP